MSARVAERYALAQRVASRAVLADSVGDPAKYLDGYRDKLREFAQLEASTRDLQLKLNTIIDFKASAPKFTVAGDDAYRAEYADYTAKLKALRAEIPRNGEGSPVRVRLYVDRYGFDKLNDPAKHFCLAVIQQLVLPPKPRKALEAAFKFWDKSTRRFRPKARSLGEEYDFEYTVRYFEDLELYRKYETVFEQILKEAKPHSAEGEGATSLKAGPFTVINAGGFDSSVMDAKVKLVEDCVHRLERIGLGKVCYGNVVITNRLSAQAHTQAFYHIASDELFIRADKKVTMDGVQAVCHELAHRYHFKFLGRTNPEVKKLYTTLKYSKPSLSDMPRPEKGESLTWKGKTYIVDSIDWNHEKIKMKDPEETDPRVSYSLPLSVYPQAKGLPPPKRQFVTPYAESGGPDENLAEMIAFYAMGKLSDEEIELLKPLL